MAIDFIGVGSAGRTRLVGLSEVAAEGRGRAFASSRSGAPRSWDFLRRRYASAIQQGDDRTAARLRGQLNELMSGRLAGIGPP